MTSLSSIPSRIRRAVALAATGAALATADGVLAQPKVTFADHVLPVVEQHCAKCHNPDKKKGDLDLTSHAGVLKGGGTGPVVVSGNVEASKLIKSVTHAEEPFMPPNKPPLPEKDLAVFRNWIAGGLLETSGSKAVAATKPKVDLTLKVSNAGKPDGPPPMPGELPVDPVVHTPRPSVVRSLAASPWAPVVALAGQKQILLYNVTNLDLAGVLPFPDGQPLQVQFSRNGKLLLAGGGHGAKSGHALVWDIESGRRITTVGKEYDSVLAADLSPDQSKVALGGPDRLVKIYATGSSELLHKMKKHTDWVTALAFSPDGTMLASADRNGGVTVWDADDAQELFSTPGHKSGVSALSWRADSKLLASSSDDGTIKLWETTEGKQAKTWNAHSGGALDVAYSRDGRFVTCGRDGAVLVWDANGNKVKTMTMAGEMAVRCAWTLDDSAVVAADFTGQVSVWEAKSGKLLGHLESNPLPLNVRVAAARQRVTTLASRTNSAPDAITTAAREVASLASQVEAARAVADKAAADFGTKAAVVVRLKETAAQPNPSAGINEQLTAARAAREAARAARADATNAVAALFKSLAAAEARLSEAKKHDTTAELATARRALARLEEAELITAVYHAREKVGELNQELAALNAAPGTNAAPLHRELAQQQSKLQELIRARENLAKQTASAPGTAERP